METAFWYVAIGILLLAMAGGRTRVERWPISSALLYLLVGAALGPWGLGRISIGFTEHAQLIEHLTEIAILVSLFAAGLKLPPSLTEAPWQLVLRLATVSMVATALLIAVAAHYWFDLSWGAALLLGAALSPTDPVLASDVQVANPSDRDRLRIVLTGEAGLNDGTAFPLVSLGLGLLGLHPLGPGAVRWLAVDVLWAIVGGVGIGLLSARLVAQLMVWMRRRGGEVLGFDEFLAIGLIAISYGLSLAVHASGFLAVFFAGLMIRRFEREHADGHMPHTILAETKLEDLEHAASDPKTAPAYMAHTVLAFAEQSSHLLEVVCVVAMGPMLAAATMNGSSIAFAAFLFVIVRPLSVALALGLSTVPFWERWLISWFGIRGIGSLYYLSYALTHGLSKSDAQPLIGLVLATVASSVAVHGVTVTPLMRTYRRARES